LHRLPEVFSGPRPDIDSPKAFIRLTGAELDEEETMDCEFTQFRALAALRRSSACDRRRGIARRHRLRETGPE
jgi:hypothetical protein